MGSLDNSKKAKTISAKQKYKIIISGYIKLKKNILSEQSCINFLNIEKLSN